MRALNFLDSVKEILHRSNEVVVDQIIISLRICNGSCDREGPTLINFNLLMI